MPYVLAKGMRDAQIASVNYIHFLDDDYGVTNSQKKSNRQLPYDRFIVNSKKKRIRRLLGALFLVARIVRDGAIVHYHGTTILPFHLDAWIFRLFNIPTVITWGGTDARITEVAVNINPYFFRYGEYDWDARKRKMLQRLANFGVRIAADPEMAIYMKAFFKDIHQFWQPIDAQKLDYKPPEPSQKKPLLLHIPTHPFVKGTVHIRHAFERLKSEGLSFDYEIAEPNLTQEQFRKKLSECDIYVDELRCGTYGYTAVEAAGSGKPTVTYILEQVVAQYPADLPFVNANPDTIYDVLKMLILDGELRHDIGKKSRDFVVKYHDIPKTVQDLIQYYRSLGAKI